MRRLLDYPVLVLNLNYEPLNVCNVKRAITLVVVGKAEDFDRPLKTFGQVSTLTSPFRRRPTPHPRWRRQRPDWKLAPRSWRV